mmetsp:Transcript_11261/g.34987  ORF Transcript_11261/g.34987 Transcript_11261/m.34987 type:complete len:517 (-) Transcript_11261:251-1801(-)
MGCTSSKEVDHRDPVFTVPPKNHNSNDTSRGGGLSNPCECGGGGAVVRRTFARRHTAAPDSPGALLAAEAAAQPSPASLAAASIPNTPARGVFGKKIDKEPASDDEVTNDGVDAAGEEVTPSVAATTPTQPGCAAARPNPRSGLARKRSLRNVKTVVATPNPLAVIGLSAVDADFDRRSLNAGSMHSDASSRSLHSRADANVALPGMHRFESIANLPAPAGSNATTAPARRPFAKRPVPSFAVRSCDLRIPSAPTINSPFAFELPRAAVDATPGPGTPRAKSKFLRAGNAFKKRGVPSPENTPPALRSGAATNDQNRRTAPAVVGAEAVAVCPESEIVLSSHPQLGDIIRDASDDTRRQWAEAALREPAALLNNVKLRRVEEWLASLGRSPAPVPQLGAPGAPPAPMSARNLSRNEAMLLGMEGRRTCSTTSSMDGDIRRRRSSARTPFGLASATTPVVVVAANRLGGDASTDALQREIAALADSQLVQSTMGFSRDSAKGSQCPVDPLIDPTLVQ